LRFEMRQGKIRKNECRVRIIEVAGEQALTYSGATVESRLIGGEI